MSKLVFRMSSSGYCPKRLSAMMLGTPKASSPPWLERSAEEGNWHEARIKQELRDLGCIITREQEELVLDYPTFTLVGHIDGAIKLSGEVLDSPKFDIVFVNVKREDLDFSKYFLLEVKSLSFLEYQTWMQARFEAFPWYASQSTCYERTLGTNIMVYAIKDRINGGRKLYVIKGEQASMPEIIDRLDLVAQFVSVGQLAPAEFNLDSRECRRFCAYREELCSPVKVVADNLELVQAAHDYLVGRRAETAGKEQADAAKAILVNYAQTKHIDRWRSGSYSVTYSSYDRESISIKSLEEIMQRELFEEAISVSGITRIRVVDTEEVG